MLKYATIIIGTLLCLEAFASETDTDTDLKRRTRQTAIEELEGKIRSEQAHIDTVRTHLQEASARIKRFPDDSSDNPAARNAIEVFLKMQTTTQQENIARYQKKLDALRSEQQAKGRYDFEPVEYGEWLN